MWFSGAESDTKRGKRDESDRSGVGRTGGRAKRLIEASKGPYDKLIEACKDSGSTNLENARTLRRQLDDVVAPSAAASSAPSTSATSSAPPKPFVITPDGARLKIGESASFEYAAKGSSQQRFQIRVTGVDKASADDLAKFGDRAKDLGQVFYLRYSIVELDRPTAVTVSMTTAHHLDPRFRVKTSDGSEASRLTAMGGTFTPCSRKTRAAEWTLDDCQLVAVKGAGATITEVGLFTFDGGYGDKARFSWVP